MGKIKVTQVKSAINRTGRQKLTLKALGLGKINRTVEHEACLLYTSPSPRDTA